MGSISFGSDSPQLAAEQGPGLALGFKPLIRQKTLRFGRAELSCDLTSYSFTRTG